MNRDCSAIEACTHHNLHCGYPRCEWGRAQRDISATVTSSTESKLETALTALKNIAEYTGNGPMTTPWQDIVRKISQEARSAVEKIEGA